MSDNQEVLDLVSVFGATPGFRVLPLPDGYKLIRLPFPGVPENSVKVNRGIKDSSFQNTLHRIRRRLGWSHDLYQQLNDVLRKHRIEDTDPQEDIDACLSQAFGVTKQEEVPSQREPEAVAVVQRHAGKANPRKSPRAAGKTTVTAGAVQAPVQRITAGPIQAEMISPERAADLLEKLAPYQRPLRVNKYQEYAAAMARGEWELNPADPICIDVNDQTANGQHRMWAVIECGLPQPFYVAYDVPVDSYKNMDRGTRRTTADMLHGAGETSTTLLSSVAKLAHLWFVSPGHEAQDRWKKTPPATEPQIFSLLEAHPDLRESVRLGRLGGGLKAIPTASVFAHYLISRKCGGTERVTAWYQAIANMDFRPGAPGHSLGLYFLKQTQAARRRVDLKGRSYRDLHVYLILRAWNHTCRGKEMRQVAWKEDFIIPQPQAPGPHHTLPAP